MDIKKCITRRALILAEAAPRLNTGPLTNRYCTPDVIFCSSGDGEQDTQKNVASLQCLFYFSGLVTSGSRWIQQQLYWAELMCHVPTCLP
uniref:Uncharacterized protein n=1 Tax=Zea mays TaxID=4577 RepID=C4J1G4_MAIZE|nr:unknown [Zea mays]